MNTDFALFQKYFREYQECFGLNGYQAYFKYEPLDGSYARIVIRPSCRVATASLNSELTEAEEPDKDIKKTARHEALHLLVYGLEDLAKSRFVGEWAVDEASEELVNKLEKLIG